MKIVTIGKKTDFGLEFIRKIILNNDLMFRSNSLPNLCLINLEQDINSNEKQQIANIFECKNDSILVLENIDESVNFSDKLLFSLNAKKAIITLNNESGRQNLLILEQNNEIGASCPDSLEPQFFELENKRVREELINSIDENIKTIDETLQDDSLNIALNWLRDDRHFNYSSISLKDDNEIVPRSKIRAEGSITIPEFTYKTYASGQTKHQTSCRSYLSYDVSLVAVNNDSSKPSKYLKFTATESFVKVDKLAVDTYGEKGDCTLRGVVKIYPGSKFSHDQSDFGAPAGWRMKACSPNTPNSKNSYQRTTGWTFSFEGSGGGGSEGPKGEVKAGISYSTSDVYSTEFNDFEVVNKSSSLYGSWEYRFELLYSNCKDAFTGNIDIDVKPLPKLSYSRLPLNNEVIYEIDRNINGYQRINFFIQHSTAFLYSYFWSGYGYKVNNNGKNIGKRFRWEMVNINLGLVSF